MSGKKQIPYGERVGTLVGRGSEQNTLRAAIAFAEMEKAPVLGEFLVIEETEFRQRRLLCRVDEVTYGDFHTTSDERERTLVEKYIRDVSGHKRALSEEEKRMLFFLHYTLRVLAEFREEGNSGKQRIATDFRILPALTADLRYPTEQELKVVTTAGLPEKGTLPAVGHLSFGETEVENVPICFDVSRFAARRTAIFARTGYGKSNLAKFVVTLAGITSDSGMVILDLDGEYAFNTPGDAGAVKSYGLTEIPHLRERLVVFTNRAVQNASDGQVRPLMNFREMSSYDIKRLIPRAIGEEETAVARDFARIIEHEKVKDKWDEVLNIAEQVKQDPTRWREEEDAIEELCEVAYEKGKIRDNQRNLFISTVKQLLPLHNPNGTDFFEEVQEALKNKKVVILDLSLFHLQHAIQIASVVLERIFRYNQYRVTTGQMVPVIAVFEEAQNVLNNNAVDKGESIFVRWAKEGRKYGLGLIYVTQQPGAIAEEILSQTDNFFVMHLLSRHDVDALIRANRHYDGVVSHFLASETVVGNAYIYSAPYQPYVFPAHIWEFKPEVFDRLFPGHQGSVSRAN